MKLDDERMVEFFENSPLTEDGLDLLLPDDLALLHYLYGIESACVFLPS